MNEEGAFKTTTLTRVPIEERWNKEAIEDMKWTQWQIKGRVESEKDIGHESRITYDPFLEIHVDKSIDLPTPPKIEGDAMPRRVYITKAILEKCGMTDGCMGCVASATGHTAVVHNEECRQRIEGEMKRDPETSRSCAK